MSDPATILGVGVVDAVGITGVTSAFGARSADVPSASAPPRAAGAPVAHLRMTWEQLGVSPLGSGRTYRELFGAPHTTFRRLDRTTRLLLLATEAAGLVRSVPAELRDRVALVIETERGSLETDLRFASTLDTELVEGAAFPFTLANASLGEVALHHKLRGPSLCLSIDADERGAALHEALALLRDDEADHVLVGRVEALTESRGDLDAALSCVVVLLARTETGASAVVPWPVGARDVLGVLASSTRHE